MNRRRFCRNLTISASIVAITPILKACSTPVEPLDANSQSTVRSHLPTPDQFLSITDTPVRPTTTTMPAPSPSQTVIEDVSSSTPTPTILPNTTRVALVRTTDRVRGVKQAIELLDLTPAKGRPVLLKPNFNSADPSPGSTDNDVLHSISESLFNMGATSITVCDRSGMGDTRRVMQQKRIFDLADELGLKVEILDELPDSKWVIRDDSDFHWKQGIAVPDILLDAECIVQSCNLKTHRYGGHFTMSLKNSVGFVAKKIGNGHDYMTELHNSSFQRHMIAEINSLYSPALIVMDGTYAFVKGGPAVGELVQSEVVLAGTDPIAIDAIGVAILRLFGTTREVNHGKIFQQEQIARAVELGLGIQQPHQIQFITPDAESAAYATQIQQLLNA